MLDIVGNIVINDQKRWEYLKATVKSFDFLKGSPLFLNIERSCVPFDEVKGLFSNWTDANLSNLSNPFGTVYYWLVNQGKSPWILHFEEDHFCECDDITAIEELLNESEDAQIIRASFFDIEQNTFKHCKVGDILPVCKTYYLDRDNFDRMQHHYGSRYYIGNNAFFERKYALKYWSRFPEATRPHAFEVPSFSMDLIHTVSIPNFPMLVPIDDNHGEPNTCLLDNPTQKWSAVCSELLTKTNSLTHS